jgi:hypothetical protein
VAAPEPHSPTTITGAATEGTFSNEEGAGNIAAPSVDISAAESLPDQTITPEKQQEQEEEGTRMQQVQEEERTREQQVQEEERTPEQQVLEEERTNEQQVTKASAAVLMYTHEQMKNEVAQQLRQALPDILQQVHQNKVLLQQLQTSITGLLNDKQSNHLDSASESIQSGRLAALEEQMAKMQDYEVFKEETNETVYSMQDQLSVDQEQHASSEQRNEEQAHQSERRLALLEQAQAATQKNIQDQDAALKAAVAATAQDNKTLREELRRKLLSNEGSNTQKRAGSTTDSADECSFYFKGIQALKRHIHNTNSKHDRTNWLGADPAQVISHLLSKQEINAYGAVHRISPVDIASGGHRSESDAVIINMSSVFHKKSVIIRMRQYIFRHRELMAHTHIADCYSPEEQNRARALQRYGGHLKEQKRIDGSRVNNRRGTAVMETFLGNGDWTRRDVNEATLQPFYLTREEREEARTSNSTTTSAEGAPARVTQPQPGERGEEGAGERGRGERAAGPSNERSNIPNSEKSRANKAHNSSNEVITVRASSPILSYSKSDTAEERAAQIKKHRAEQATYGERRIAMEAARQHADWLAGNLGRPPTRNQTNRNGDSYARGEYR